MGLMVLHDTAGLRADQGWNHQRQEAWDLWAPLNVPVTLFTEQKAKLGPTLAPLPLGTGDS